MRASEEEEALKRKEREANEGKSPERSPVERSETKSVRDWGRRTLEGRAERARDCEVGTSATPSEARCWPKARGGATRSGAPHEKRAKENRFAGPSEARKP